MGSNPDNILFIFFFLENILSSTSIVMGQSSTGTGYRLFKHFFRSQLPAL